METTILISNDSETDKSFLFEIVKEFRKRKLKDGTPKRRLRGGYGLIIFSEESIHFLPTKVGVCSNVINARSPIFFGAHWTHIFENFDS